MLSLKDNSMNLTFFKRVLKEIKNNDRYLDIIDSFSESQFRSKIRLFDLLDSLGIDYINARVVIFGSWYGSIIIPELLSKKVKFITAIDKDERVLKIAKNNFFPNRNDLDFILADASVVRLSRYSECNLVINTACEHMPPVSTWQCWKDIAPNTIFAFQSNNMDFIPEHVNCVYSIQEFISQLPANFKVIAKGETKDARGIRYSIVGQII